MTPTGFLRPRPRPRPLTRVTAALAVAGLLSLTQVGAAEAHVRAIADNATAGSFTALTFRVPNESDRAGTVKVVVQLPQDTPLLYVSSKPVPGWTAELEEATLPKPVDVDGTTITKAVRTVTWTADGRGRIGPGEYQEFSLSVGPLPDAQTLLLPTEQTYSDGKVSSWTEPTPPTGEEPEHPAPELVVTAAPVGEATASPAEQPPVVAAAGTGPDVVARGLGAAGLVLGLAALVVAVLGRRRAAGPSA